MPYHLDPQKIPTEVTEVYYKFDSKTIRWRLNTAVSPQKQFLFKGDVWMELEQDLFEVALVIHVIPCILTPETQ